MKKKSLAVLTESDDTLGAASIMGATVEMLNAAGLLEHGVALGAEHPDGTRIYLCVFAPGDPVQQFVNATAGMCTSDYSIADATGELARRVLGETEHGH